MTELETAQKRIAALEAELVKEAKHCAEETLRANQMAEQHRMQANMATKARAELAAMRALGEPVARITSMDEYGPSFGWFKHWNNFPIGTRIYTQPPAAQDEERKPLGFFAMSDDFGFERHSTAQGARASANAILSELRDSAQSGEWPMESESVCWGAILERAAETEVIEDCCDYVLQGAAIAAQGDSNA